MVDARLERTVGDAAYHVVVGGSGPPVLLLHGFPQTHLMWRHVAADLAADHTVICPDLRGYGASDKPADPDGTGYAKRTMAADIVALARALGHTRFALAGHDRGALVAFRAALDHPAAITHLACLDVLPTLDMWEALHGTTAAVGFHLHPKVLDAAVRRRIADLDHRRGDVGISTVDPLPEDRKACLGGLHGLGHLGRGLLQPHRLVARRACCSGGADRGAGGQDEGDR